MSKLDLTWLLRGLIDLFKIPSAYYTLKTYPEEAKKSQAIGLRGLIWLLAGMIVGPLSIYMFTTSLNMFSKGLIIGAIFLIILTFVVAFYTIILGFLNGLVCSIYQLRLNRRPLGWIDLVLTILMVAEVVALFIWLSKV